MSLLQRATGASVRKGVFSLSNELCARTMSAGEVGSGKTKGGGGGGAVREAGGAFGRQEAAREEEHFRKLQADQLRELKKELHTELNHHEAERKYHEDAISRHKQEKGNLQHEENALRQK